MVIGHTRLATRGRPEENVNNQPHAAGTGGDRWAAVCNGVIPGHRDKAAALGLPLRSECDSDLLVQTLARYGGHAGPDVCLSFGGKQSVLAIDTQARTMLAWTNGELPLVAFRVEDWPALWWASTEEIACEALEAVGLGARFAAAEPEVHYRMDVRGGEVALRTVELQRQCQARDMR